MEPRLPLYALLSQVLVAFTIEFDNEFEHQVPHRTTRYGSTPGSGPWLVSMVMWLMIMRYIPDDGIAVQELQKRTGLDGKSTRAWLVRLSKWWGYLAVESRAAVHPTPGGRKALQAWRPLTGTIEKRWRERFGKDRLDQLWASLRTLADKFEKRLPDYLPILGFDMLSKPSGCESSSNTLPALLATVLLTFAVEFEIESGLSLAVCANVLRLADKDGVGLRDLPRLSGVSKEAIAMACGRLEERGLATMQSESRVKTLVLTPKGTQTRKLYLRLVEDIEERWLSKFGSSTQHALRHPLEQLVADPALLRGVEPYPDGWRAAVPKLDVLPHFPMVLHRGGFPDGS
ncbi:MAG TPA: MarR family winged helix-turn-helix transcriptional regulator [Bryobacteraceae bacterium]|nr:MarR family winged helix-turn-helix transcriptional regulator [Bryobacteraceae bacterium]